MRDEARRRAAGAAPRCLDRDAGHRRRRRRASSSCGAGGVERALGAAAARASDDLYSYRRDGVTGRFAGIVQLGGP